MFWQSGKSTIITVTLSCLVVLATIATPDITKRNNLNSGLSVIKDDRLSRQRNNLEESIKNILNNETKSNPNYSSELVFSTVKEAKIEQHQQQLLPPKSSASFPYVHPVMAPRKSSGFGHRVHPIRGYSSHHKGLDLAAPVGVNIRAMAEGRVIFADPYAGYGNLVVIDHGNQITTHYAHCDKLKIQPGAWVKAGQIIAEVGSTGASTGPHLHLEVRIKGQAINPEKFFEGLFSEAKG